METVLKLSVDTAASRGCTLPGLRGSAPQSTAWWRQRRRQALCKTEEFFFSEIRFQLCFLPFMSMSGKRNHKCFPSVFLSYGSVSWSLLLSHP